MCVALSTTRAALKLTSSERRGPHSAPAPRLFVQYNKEFGYSRKDVILIGAGILALGCGSYYGLQAAGVEAGMAGNFVQLFVILGISLGWVGSYLYRVATKVHEGGDEGWGGFECGVGGRVCVGAEWLARAALWR